MFDWETLQEVTLKNLRKLKQIYRINRYDPNKSVYKAEEGQSNTREDANRTPASRHLFVSVELKQLFKKRILSDELH